MREPAPRPEPAAGRVILDYCATGTGLERRGPFSRFKDGISFEWRPAMTIRHLNDRHYDWKHMIDYETFWILTFSAVVLGSGIFALFSIAQNNAITLP
jgi:hypothetical protein